MVANPKKKNPYRIEPPFNISFSGGRSSGYMLYHILDAYDGKLPDDGHVLFANTGKECEESLEFVRDCGEKWNILIHWLEYDPELSVPMKEVDFKSASRKGEPFEKLLEKHPILPNVVRRLCTRYLKVELFGCFMSKKQNYECWNSAIGIRADERFRVAKMRQSSFSNEFFDTDDQSFAFPLYDAGVVKMRHIIPFWKEQSFDLRLPDNGDGRTLAGNCDLCFLKSPRVLKRLIREQPQRADWWINMEKLMRQKVTVRRMAKGDFSEAVLNQVSFVLGTTYTKLKRQAWMEGNRMIITDDTSIGCFCGD